MRRVRVLSEDRRVKVVKKRDRLNFKEPWYRHIDGGEGELFILLLLLLVIALAWLVMAPFPAGRRKLKQWRSKPQRTMSTQWIQRADIQYVTTQETPSGSFLATIYTHGRPRVELEARGRSARRLRALLAEFPTEPVNQAPPGWG